jgi:hypothetical protein
LLTEGIGVARIGKAVTHKVLLRRCASRMPQARYGKKAAPRADLESAKIPNRQIGG